MSPLDPEETSQGRKKVCSGGKGSSQAQSLLPWSMHLLYFSQKHFGSLSLTPGSALVTVSPTQSLWLLLGDADNKQVSKHTLSGCPGGV